VAERLRFFFDQHIPYAVAQGLRRRAVDVVTAQEADRCELADREQLNWARDNERVLVTFDDDFLAIAAGGAPHAGIAYCSASKYSIGELIYALLLLHDALSFEDMHDHIEFL
jgi:predicted nuclease of predicted toxin-antitoxin system